MPSLTLIQSPPPGSRCLALCGQRVRFELKVDAGNELRAFLRTTVGRAAQRREEVIQEVEQGLARQGAEWHDVPMKAAGDGLFTLELPLDEVGVFESRAFVLVGDSEVPVWPEMQGNAVIKAEPAWTARSCGVYGAFVRLFQNDEAWKLFAKADLEKADLAGWTVIPPSGKLQEVQQELPHIVDTLGFGIVLLPPIFPTPTTYARMGRFGSPFAPLDFYSVDPALAEFDRHMTPLEQMEELTDAIHARGARVFIDVPINHTGWASRMQTLHPEWFEREDDGAFKSPGAWGVTWEDLVEMKYDDRALWQEMASVFLFWCRQGVDGFRCDAGYMLPTPVWEYITAKVRREFPDTVFLLEGLGGPVPKTLELLGVGGLDWAYSELFQNYHRAQVEWYLGQSISQTFTHGLQVHFAETHDNNRLAEQGRSWALMRTALSALGSANGAWAITAGLEWLAKEKIDVHGCSSLNRGAKENIVSQIAALNGLLRHCTAFHAGASMTIITSGESQTLALKRTSADGRVAVLVLVNLEPQEAETAEWAQADADPGTEVLWSSGSFDRQRIVNEHGLCSVLLSPGEAACVSLLLSQSTTIPSCVFDAPATTDTECQHWVWALDARRVFPWLADRHLVLEVPGRHRFELEAEGRIVACGFGENTSTIPRGAAQGPARLKLTRFAEDEGLHSFHNFAVLQDHEAPMVDCAVIGPLKHDSELHAVLTNGRGGMSQVRAAWGSILTQYDSMLAANLHPTCPVDRRMLFARCRAWVRRRGYSTELSGAWLKSFVFTDADRAQWHFELPVGEGKLVLLTAELQLHEGRNAVSLRFLRTDELTDKGITLVLRPDVEDRGFHEKTVLSDEALKIWADATKGHTDGCDVPIYGSRLMQLRINSGAFYLEPERVTVAHPQDADRGLGGSSDLFSPGFFIAELDAGRAIELGVAADEPNLLSGSALEPLTAPVERPMAEVARAAIRQFMVKRDDGLTVIAGYPWFLDWGRDTLIALRGIIAAGWLDEAREILRTFAAFEDRGSLPNMIRGGDASNRDTSDAPLWFFVAAHDLLKADGSPAFLDSIAGGRTIKAVMLSIAEHYMSGTPNGIRMDEASGLIYSPPHFTWMDTNHPAGTPREGYPICLQSKWHLALNLLATVDGDPKWAALAGKVRASIMELYTTATNGAYLSDCLHAGPGTPAALATRDDHLRPNQLFAITLGAIDPQSEIAANVIKACETLILPGAVRTIADRPVKVPLRVERNGALLNDPTAPFWPQYRGDEDTRRKPAYHNGTAWPWPAPSYMEALMIVRGVAAKPEARALLAAAKTMFEEGCLGHLPEIADGAAPHHQRGCGAQAWSVSEWFRVWELASS